MEMFKQITSQSIPLENTYYVTVSLILCVIELFSTVSDIETSQIFNNLHINLGMTGLAGFINTVADPWGEHTQHAPP